ncbi:MAG: phosphoribosylaminoimidazolesuccinocarboxamide synthase [Bacteroidota bacterium]
MSAVVTDASGPGLSPLFRGKVRDVFEAGDRLMLVATDRLSAFDVVLPDGIPGKGEVLTRISAFWFRKLAHLVPHHLLSISSGDFPPPFRERLSLFEGRSMLVRKAAPIAVECVARGYLAGSAWEEYSRTGAVCGIPLPGGLRESDRLPEPLFTPAFKSPRGMHDRNITFQETVLLAGEETAVRLRDITLRLYQEGRAHAEARGVIIADTKFEFGLDTEGELIWIDEALTPDSSRFWPLAEYRPGGPQPSFDKQYVRDYLASVGWNRTPPGPSLPPDVIRTTGAKYREALRLLTDGETL